MKSAVRPLCQRSAHYLQLPLSLPGSDLTESWWGILFWTWSIHTTTNNNSTNKSLFQLQSNEQMYSFINENDLYVFFLFEDLRLHQSHYLMMCSYRPSVWWCFKPLCHHVVPVLKLNCEPAVIFLFHWLFQLHNKTVRHSFLDDMILIRV